MKKYLILDCYVDEPACFGVPPFISPYPRYICGALIDAGIAEENIVYSAIDSLRSSEYSITSEYAMVFIIGGAVVPGKYLGAKIGSLAEINRIISTNPAMNFAVGGPVSRIINKASNALSIDGDIEKFAHHFVKGENIQSQRSTDEIARWAVLGSKKVVEHPYYPDVICEIETSRGCPRLYHCSFCSEGLIKNIEFRQEEDILNEVESLIKAGVHRFRIGRQADILQYQTKMNNFRNGFPEPNPDAAISLFSNLKRLKNMGDITILNIDNGNPGTIVNFRDESSRILQELGDAVTPGDTLALGIESFDEDVINANNLKVSPEEALLAVRIINDVCGERRDNIPALLPGINLIHGLTGETSSTFRKNYEWLKKIMDEDLLLKRINIRKLQPFPDTEIFSRMNKISQKTVNRFEYYRDKIRSDIDPVMLKRIYPAGTVLKDVHILENRSGYSLGKQISSYSITCKFPVEQKTGSFTDSVVVNHRDRSIIALPGKLNINAVPIKALESIPGVSRKIAGDIVLARPFSTEKALLDFIDKYNIPFLKKLISSGCLSVSS